SCVMPPIVGALPGAVGGAGRQSGRCASVTGMPRFPTLTCPRRPATRRAAGSRRGLGRLRFAAATAAPSLLFAGILGVGGVIAWRDPYARPPALPTRRPPVWGLPAAGAALGAATIAGATVVARGPGGSAGSVGLAGAGGS